MKNGSILILSNNPEIGQSIADKIKLLRDYDNIQHAEFIEAVSLLNSNSQPSLIIVYCSNTDSISIIKEIRTLKQLDKVPVILVMDYFKEEKLLYAFDNGADDFFFLNDADSVILIRILLSMQKYILYKQLEISNDILGEAGITEESSGIYTKEHAPMVLGKFFDKSIKENLEDTVFMCVRPAPLPNKRFNMKSIIANISGSVKKVSRGSDITAYSNDYSFYLLLYNAGPAGARSVYNRIKHAVHDLCRIYADAAEVTASFEEMEPVMMRSLKDQINADLEFNYLYDLNLNRADEETEAEKKPVKKVNKKGTEKKNA